MVPKTLWLDGTFPELLPGCCPNKVYALLHNQQGQALKPTAGFYSFQNYLSINHADYAILLVESAERTKYYSAAITSAFQAIPVTPAGEEYTLEFWVRHLVTTGFSRDEDELLEARPVFWTGNFLSRTRLSDGDITAAAVFKPQVQFAYDSQGSVMHFLAWLEKDGVLVTDPTALDVLWSKRDGTELMHLTRPGSAVMATHPGVWTWDLNLMDLDPDDCTPLRVTVTDADSVAHVSESAAVSWD